VYVIEVTKQRKKYYIESEKKKNVENDNMVNICENSWESYTTTTTKTVVVSDNNEDVFR